LTSSKSNSNEIYISQSGYGLSLDIRQRSENNYIDYSETSGYDNNVKIYQGIHDDGSYDFDEEGGHEAYWTITGTNNDLESYQTDTNRGAGGGAAHHLANIVNGDYNSVSHTQMGKAGHDGFIEIQGDNNNVILYQRGNGGQQWADIVLTGDGHSVDASQRGTMAHSFDVDLTNGGGAYSITSTQTTNNTETSKTYSLTGTCTNTTGCSVTITQN
jgi:hypothetical protein